MNLSHLDSKKIIKKEQEKIKRFKLHRDVFKTEPNVRIALDNYWKDFLDIIIKINVEKGIVTEIKHYTTWNNLMSIILCDLTLYGAKTLKSLKVDYDKASLVDYDVLNGDEDVICFSTNNVDKTCLRYADLKIIIKLADIENIPNCFCKIVDLGVVTKKTSKVTIGNWTMKVVLNYKKGFYPSDQVVIFKNSVLKKKLNVLLSASRSEGIFYDLKQVNAFFASYIFKVINTSGDNSLRKDIKIELERLSAGDRLKKLIEIGKALSFYSEVNFSSVFKMAPDKIKIISLETGNELPMSSEILTKIKKSQDPQNFIINYLTEEKFIQTQL